MYNNLERKVAERNKELKLLYDISRVLSQAGDFETKAARVMERLAQATWAEWATLRVERDDEPGLHLVAAAGPAVSTSPPMPVLTDAETLAASAMREGTVIVTNDYPNEPNASTNIVALGMKSMVLIPIRAGGHTLGLVSIVSKETQHFSPELVRLLAAVGEGLGVLLENVRLDQQLQIQEQLHQSQAAGRALLESAPQGIITSNAAGEILQVNDAALAIFGYRREDLLGQAVDMLLPQELRPGHAGQRESYFSHPETRPMGHGRDLVGLRKDGSFVPVEIGLGCVQTQSGPIALAFISDISKRKRAEEAERQWAEENSVMAEIGRTVSASLDIKDIYEDLGEQIRKLIPFDRMYLSLVDQEDRDAFQTWDLGVPGRRKAEKLPLIGTLSGNVLRTRTSTIVEAHSEQDLRHRFPGLVAGFNAGLRSSLAVPLLDRETAIGILQVRSKQLGVYTQRHMELLERIGSQIAGSIANSRLYAELLQADDALRVSEAQTRASLGEKEVLLKEINHRVKNNLQIISSLLNLQSREIKDEQALRSFQVSQDRIRAMALVHEKLYQSDDLARIDFGEYIKSLATDLGSSYGLASRDIELKIDVENILLGVDKAIPCGVIVNELVANSLKHAFPGDRPGEIVISFREIEGQYAMVFKDDGVGLPEDLDVSRPCSLGLTIVNALTGQLGGSISLVGNGGTEIHITFPAKRTQGD